MVAELSVHSGTGKSERVPIDTPKLPQITDLSAHIIGSKSNLHDCLCSHIRSFSPRQRSEQLARLVAALPANSPIMIHFDSSADPHCFDLALHRPGIRPTTIRRALRMPLGWIWNRSGHYQPDLKLG